MGHTATLLEWDDNIPSFDEVHGEALKATRYLEPAASLEGIAAATEEAEEAVEEVVRR